MNAERLHRSIGGGLTACILVLLLFNLTTRLLVCGISEGLGSNMFIAIPVYGAAALWLIKMSLEKRMILARTKLSVPILFFVCLSVLSAAASHYPRQSFSVAFEWVTQVIIFFLIVNVLPQEHRLRAIAAALVGVGVMSCMVALHQHFVGFRAALADYLRDPQGTVSRLGLPPSSMADFRSRLESWRVYGTFLLPNTFAGFCIILLPFELGLLLDNLRKRNAHLILGRIVIAGVMLLQLIAVYLSGSKGAWFSLLIVGLLWGLLFLGRRLARRTRAAMAALLVLVLTAGACIVLLRPELCALTQKMRYSMEARVDYWKGAIRIIKRHPFLGVGLDNFRDYYPQYKLPAEDPSQKAHNNYLQILAEMGPAGLVAFCSIWVCFFLMREHRNNHQPAGLQDSTRAPPNRDTLILTLAVTVGAVFLAMHLFAPFPMGIGGFALMLAAGVAAIVAVLSLPTGLGRRTLSGIAAAVACFLVHSLVDIDLYEPGLMEALWVLIAISVALSGAPAWERRLSRGTSFVLSACAMVGFIAFSFLLTRPLLTAEELLTMGKNEVSAGNMKEAVKYLEAGAKFDRRNAESHLLLAQCYHALWRQGTQAVKVGTTFQMARFHAQRAVQLNPLSPTNHFVLARILWEGAWDDAMRRQAEEQYRRAMELYPSKPLYVASYAIALHARGADRKTVTTLLERALRLDEIAPRTSDKLDGPTRKAILEALGKKESADQPQPDFPQPQQSSKTPQ